jgi:flavin reductase (DIM6/NTAB) family NADH-FMN oxidoreductase RutF
MNEQAKSDLLNKLTYGLYVLTSAAGDDRGGMLITWVMQTSFDPPMIAVAVQTGAHTTAVMRQSGVFALNFMSDEQRKEAGKFGQEHAKVGDKLGKIGQRPGAATGSPVLDSAIGHLECRITGWLRGGDHDVALAQIVAAEVAHDAPLMTTVSSGMGYAG